MSKQISINYCLSGTDTMCVVALFYAVEVSGASLSIACHLEANNVNLSWLHLRKFEVKSVLKNGNYLPLFNEQNNIRTLDGSLFVDLAYRAIMVKEKLPMNADAFVEA